MPSQKAQSLCVCRLTHPVMGAPCLCGQAQGQVLAPSAVHMCFQFQEPLLPLHLLGKDVEVTRFISFLQPL